MAKKKKSVKKTAARASASKPNASAKKSPAARAKTPARQSAARKTPVVKKNAVRPARKATKMVVREPVKNQASVRSKAPDRRSRPAASAHGAAVPALRTAESKARKMGKKDMAFFRKLLLDLKDRVIDRVNFLSAGNLNSSQRETTGDLSNYGIHMADHGTDNFDREFALSLVSNEQELLYEIDEALVRIESGTYGVCEQTGKPIEIERLKVVPYARFSLAAQEERERNRKMFRPFSSGPQGPLSSNF